MKPLTTLWLSVAVLLFTGSACLKHIQPYEPRRRQYDLPVDPSAQPEKRSDGSLWSADQPGNYIFSDQRALLVNDVVTVRIREVSSAFSDASTTLDSESDVSVGINALAGLMKVLESAYPEMDGGNIFGGGRKNEFSGTGATSRRGDVKATVPAIVRKVFPNGALFVEGHRVILVNEEEYHFYISGVVRAIDIDESNGVDSSKIADAEIEFTGRGTISEKQSPGLLARGLDWIWPF